MNMCILFIAFELRWIDGKSFLCKRHTQTQPNNNKKPRPETTKHNPSLPPPSPPHQSSVKHPNYTVLISSLVFTKDTLSVTLAALLPTISIIINSSSCFLTAKYLDIWATNRGYSIVYVIMMWFSAVEGTLVF